MFNLPRFIFEHFIEKSVNKQKSQTQNHVSSTWSLQTCHFKERTASNLTNYLTVFASSTGHSQPLWESCMANQGYMKTIAPTHQLQPTVMESRMKNRNIRSHSFEVETEKQLLIYSINICCLPSACQAEEPHKASVLRQGRIIESSQLFKALPMGQPCPKCLPFINLILTVTFLGRNNCTCSW